MVEIHFASLSYEKRNFKKCNVMVRPDVLCDGKFDSGPKSKLKLLGWGN
jgi:hypothetical protein